MPIKLNKRADIPVTILVIEVLVICSLTILSFVTSIYLDKTYPLGTELFEEIHSNVEKFYFYLNIGDSKEIAAEKIGAIIDQTGTQLIIEKSNEIISIKYIKDLKE